MATIVRGRRCEGRECSNSEIAATRSGKRLPSLGIYLKGVLQRDLGSAFGITNRKLMSSAERFQNIVFAVERLAMPMKNLSIITEEGGGNFPNTERIARSSIGDDDEPPDIDRGCRC
jgi:hypothetical protein